MRRFLVPGFLVPVAVALALSLPAQAEELPSEADVRCLLLTLGGAGSHDPNVQQGSMLGMLYYLGRINGREPDLDLQAALVAAMKSFRAEDAERESRRCSEAMLESGAELKRLADHLQAQAAKAPS
jgi:hypothetical protein